MTTAIVRSVPVSGTDKGALRSATTMKISWTTPVGGRRFAPTYSSDSTLRIGIANEDVVTRDEDPVLLSTWDNESDDIFDTL